MGDQPICPFALVEDVTIMDVTASEVTFVTRSAGDTEKDRKPRSYKVRLKDDEGQENILEKRPDEGPQPVDLIAGHSGKLYLSRKGWEVTSDGFPIFGAGTGAVVFKWPNCLEIRTARLSMLQVVPTRIVVNGFLYGDGPFRPLELLGPECAASQEISWNGAQNINIRLSATGVTNLGLSAPTTSIEIWPTSIVVHGSPTIDPSVTGKVDILDRELAAANQSFELQRTKPLISLALTPDGHARFHVVSDDVRAIAAGQLVADAKEILDDLKRFNVDDLSDTSRKSLEEARARVHASSAQ